MSLKGNIQYFLDKERYKCFYPMVFVHFQLKANFCTVRTMPIFLSNF